MVKYQQSRKGGTGMTQRHKQVLLTIGMVLALCVCLWLRGLPDQMPGSVLEGVYYQADGSDAAVSVQQVQGGSWLFLPAHADLKRLTLWFDGGELRFTAGDRSVGVTSGRSFDFAALFNGEPEDGRYAVMVSRDGEGEALTVMRSANVGSLYLASPDGEHDRTWVEQGKDHRAENGRIVLLRPDGTRVYGGLLKAVRGRGHSTWTYPKRPYQIKLKEKVDLLDTGDPGEAASTWVLLANYNDETLVHNALTFDLAAELGLPYTPHSRTVDLYYDGEYRGTYQICEKTEVGPGRVDIDDLEKEIERANPGVDDFDELPTVVVERPEGGGYQYVDGLSMPADLSGGYILELDMKGRAMEKKSWFSTSRDNYVVCKSPEYLDAEGMEYISGLYQHFEDAVYNGGTDPATGKSYREFMDAESLAKCYLVMELSQDGDAFLTSTYFYKPAGEEKLYAGPVWDFDYTYGLFGSQEDGAVLSSPEGLTAAMNSRFTIALLSVPDFQQEVRRVYEEELYPLVTGTVLGGGTGERLRPLADYGAEHAASAAMNRVLWTRFVTGSYGQALDKCRDFLWARNEWLYTEVRGWKGEPLPNERFVDVPESAWYFDAVNFVEHNGLFVGVSETRFAPEGSMTRAMAATVLHRLADSPEPARTSTFADVPEGDWFSSPVAWAEETGIAVNVSEGRFSPYRNITREELVTMLYRWAVVMEAGGGEGAPIPERYADRDRVSAWAQDAFGWAVEHEIVLGVTDTELAPGREVSRCEAAAILQRFALWQGL